MSSKPSEFQTKLLDTILRFADKIEQAFKNGNYVAALCAIDDLIENLQGIRPVIKAAIQAQENNEEFDIICNSAPPMPPEDKSDEVQLGQFPNLFTKTDHGPS